MRFCFRLVIAIILLATSVGIGCGKSSDTNGNLAVSKSNLAKIQPGMSLNDVQVIMGTGELIQNGSARVNNQRVPDEEHTWRNGDRAIVVSFVKGKVVYANGIKL